MAVDKLVDSTQLDADLTSVANAIRTKGGTSAQMAFPAGFVSAVNAIPTGAGYTLEEINTPGFPAVKGDVVFTGTRIRPFIFYNNQYITSFTGNNVINASGDDWLQYQNTANSYTFFGCVNLEEVSLLSLTDLYHTDYLFQNCTKLKVANLPYHDITRLNTAMFQNCPALEKQIYVMPKVITPVYGSFLTSNNNVTTFDIGSASVEISSGNASDIRSGAFTNDGNLSTLIIRNTNVIRGLANINAFNGTCFASDKTGGTLYVPQALLSSYQSATNWSTILGYPNNQILSIEGSIYETKYADGTPIT